MIKVENPATGGDSSRNNSPYLSAAGLTIGRQDPEDLSLSMLVRGRGKESVTLDLKDPEAARCWATWCGPPTWWWRTSAPA